MGTCKNCKHWDDGECRKIDFECSRKVPSLDNKEAVILITMDDDSGFWGRFLTGPDFGCVNFEEVNRVCHSAE